MGLELQASAWSVRSPTGQCDIGRRLPRAGRQSMSCRVPALIDQLSTLGDTTRSVPSQVAPLNHHAYA